MRIEDLAGRHVVLLGYGIDNEAVLPHVLAVEPASICVALDDPQSLRVEPRSALETAGIAIVHADPLPADTEVVVRSPGYPRYRPALLAAQTAGAEVTTPTDLWLAAHAPGRTFVAVTGTKGKSSTTSAIGAFLRAAGRDAVVAGNIGVPVWSVEPAQHDVLVVEVSSYQAVDVHARPDVGVLTSLSSDHLSWHGGQEQYERDKLSLFGAPGETAQLLIAAREPGAAAATEHLHPQVVDVESPAFAVLRDAATARDLGGPVVANLALAAAAAAAVLGAPLSDELLRAGVATFEPLQSRHQTVTVRDGIRYIDDALATNPNAAAISLSPYADLPVALILGGEDRSVALDPLRAAIAGHRGPLVLLSVPDTGAAMVDALAHDAPPHDAIDAVDVAHAVRAATDALARHGGGVVLFAPGAPTPGSQGTWKDRSAAFHAAATEQV